MTLRVTIFLYQERILSKFEIRTEFIHTVLFFTHELFLPHIIQVEYLMTKDETLCKDMTQQKKKSSRMQ